METESKQQRLIQKIGERAGLGIIALFAIVFMSFQSPEQVSSQEVVLHEEVEVKKSLSSTSISPTPIPAFINSQTESAPSLPTLTPTPTPQPTSPPIDPTQDAVWDRLADCESGGNWSIDTGNGYYGGLQFSQGAWESVGGTGNPAHASREEQIRRGKMLRDQRGGFSAWGLCAVNLGLN